MLTSLVYLQQVSVKNSKKLTKILHINEENLHIFRMNWGISMNFSEEVWFMMILKVTKKQGFTLSLSRKDSLEKEQGWGGEVKLTLPAFLGLRVYRWNKCFLILLRRQYCQRWIVFCETSRYVSSLFLSKTDLFLLHTFFL